MPESAWVKLQGVIFDLDGVIFDSRRSVVSFYNYMLEYVGLPPNAEEYADVVHRESMEVSLEYLMGKGEKYEQALDHWPQVDIVRFLQDLDLFPHVLEVLDELGERFVLAVATNRSLSARPALEHFDLWDRFQVVGHPGEGIKPKPDPGMMQMVLRGLGLHRDQVVYVGDSTVDDEFCQACGVRLIAFKNPGLRAWAHVEDFLGIPPLLDAALSSKPNK